MAQADISARLAGAKPGQSLSNTLRKQARLSALSASLLREAGEVPRESADLAARIKACPVTLNGMLKALGRVRG